MPKIDWGRKVIVLVVLSIAIAAMSMFVWSNPTIASVTGGFVQPLPVANITTVVITLFATLLVLLLVKSYVPQTKEYLDY